MPVPAFELSLAEFTLLFGVIVALLIPLLIWLFLDLEQRRFARPRRSRAIEAVKRGTAS